MEVYPHFDSEFYKNARDKSALARELGEAVIAENGIEECKKMLATFKAAQAKKNLDKPK
jgi:hypothetical protein